MAQSSSRAILLFLIGLHAFDIQVKTTLGQDHGDAPSRFAASLDSAFTSDDLEWLPEQNRLLLDGKVNGAPAVFKIDSGAMGTLLTLKSAKDRGLRIIDFNATFTGAGGTGKVYGSPVKQLQLGSAVDLPNQRLAVIDLPSLDGVDGLIGGDTLAGTGAIIDYRHKKLRVPKKKSADSLENVANDSQLIVEQLEREGNYVFARMSHGDDILRMFIDTGAQKSVIGSATAARLKLTVKETDDRLFGAGDHTPTLQKTLVERLSLGKASFRNIDRVVMPLDYLGSYSKTPIDGILGADALVRSGAVLSIADAILVLSHEEVDMHSEDKSRNP